MRNKPSSEKDLLSTFEQQLRRRLPFSWEMKVEAQPFRDGGMPDARVSLTAPDGGSVTLVVEAKAGAYPAQLLKAAEQARRFTRGSREVPCVLGPFLSSATRALLAKDGVAYADATGNMRIVVDRPALFIETSGAEKNPWPDERAIRSLKGRAAGRVVRGLLDFRPPYSLSRLAELSGSTVASAYRVVEFLEKEAVLQREPRGPVTDFDWQRLLRRWVEDYSFTKSNRVEPFLAPRGVPEVVDQLRSRGQRFAVTGSLAAARFAPAAPARMAAVYVDDIAGAAQALGLRDVEAGANVLLAQAFDDVVFDRTQEVDRIAYAAPSQVAADLLTGPGRGPSEGEEMMQWMARNEDAWRRRS